MCTEPIKCYKLNKEKLQDLVIQKKLWSFETCNEITDYEKAKQQAILYKTKQLYYEKEDGKYKIPRRIFNKSKGGIYKNCYDISELNCGHCLECIYQHAGDWALRCELETKYHEQNCFITLTYRNKDLPKNRSLKMTDLQKFWKRLRRYLARQGKKLGKPEPKIKYFACGEYGPKTLRPHYHAIIFGWKPDDLEIRGKNFQGDLLYTSKKLATIWGKGYIIIGENAEYQAAQYVAQYVAKKLGKKENLKHGREKEFITMSRKEGIGKKYLMDNFEKIWDDQGIWVAHKDGGKLKPIPKYFKKQYQQYYSGIDNFEKNNLLLLLTPYEWQQQQNIIKFEEKRTKILNENSKTWEEYLKQHNEKIASNTAVFTRQAADWEEEKEQFKIEIKERHLPEEHFKDIKEFKKVMRARRAGLIKHQKSQFKKLLEYLSDNEYIYNKYTHKFEKMPF